MSELWRDLTLGLRMLRRSPMFTAVVIATLALSVGAATTLFTIVDAVLLRPLPYPEPDRIVSLSTHPAGEADGGSSVSPSIAAWMRTARSVTSIAPYSATTRALTGAGDPVQLIGSAVAGNFFQALQAPPLLGRTLTAADDIPGASPVIVLSEHLWRERFGADPAVIGRTVHLGTRSPVVVGVMGRDRGFPRQAEYWIPLSRSMEPEPDGTTYYYSVIARLRPGATLAGSRAELRAITDRVSADHPADTPRLVADVTTLHDRLFGEFHRSLGMLFGAVTFLLLIGCANVAGLLLARGAARRGEFSMRWALGAGRWRLVRQLLVESLLLASVGAALGVLIPFWTVGAFVRLSPAAIARAGDIRVDGTVLVFAALTAILTGLLFGVLPAWFVTQDTAAAASTANRISASRGLQRLRRSFVIGQLAGAVVLLTGAGLFARSFVKIRSLELGFIPEHLIDARINLSPLRYPSARAERSFFENLLARVQAMPGVASASLADAAPPTDAMLTAPMWRLSEKDAPQVYVSAVDQSFAPTVGLSLSAGRWFGSTDVAGGEPAIVLNEAAALAIFHDARPIGQRVAMVKGITGSAQAIVTGVVRNAPDIGADVSILPHAYFLRTQLSDSGAAATGVGVLAVRLKGDAAGFETALRREVAQLDPLQPVAEFHRLDEVVARSVAPRRLNMLIIGAFAALALVLASLGLYGTLAFQVAQRGREIAIRVALGARAPVVRMMVLGHGVKLTVAGCLIGVVVSLLVSRVAASFLYGVSTHDATAMLGAPLVLLGVGAAASYFPARRASRIDPLAAMCRPVVQRKRALATSRTREASSTKNLRGSPVPEHR